MSDKALKNAEHRGADDNGISSEVHGYTGGTGGIGQQGHTPPKLTLVNSAHVTVEELHHQVRNERIKLFTGMTGAPGLDGDINVDENGDLIAPVSDEAEEKLNGSLIDKFDSMELDELKEVITSQNTALYAALATVQASNGNRGYTIGKALIRAKYLADRTYLTKGFEAWHKANLDSRSLSLRTCYKYMDIAQIPGVLNWLVLGIEKLAALKPTLQMIDDLDGKDPISDFMKRFDIDPAKHTDVEDLRFEIGVGMAMSKLKANKVVNVPRELIYDFMIKGYDLKLKDIEIMKETQGSGGNPANYIKSLIQNGQRPKVMKDTKITVESIHEKAQSLVDDIGKLLNTPHIMGNIQTDRIDTLIKKLEELKASTQASAAK